MALWIDIHTHLNMLEPPIEEIKNNCLMENVGHVINIGTGPGDNAKVLETSKKWFPYSFCTLGMHPHDAKDFDENAKKFIEQNATDPAVVAIGEVGLDFFYDHSPREIQKKVFIEMMQIAAQTKLPIEVHTRDAEGETIEILQQFSGKVKGVIHCFTGTPWLAEQALNLGYNISISGIVTFKKALELQEIVRGLPLERIHVETDAPFLAPIPHRGKKNQPAYVTHVAEFVAQLKNVSVEHLQQQTYQNALKMFPKIAMAVQ